MRGLANSCLTTLCLLRVVCCCGCSDLVLILFFWLMFVCSGWSLDYLVSAPLLYCSTKNHPALLRVWTIAYCLITEILDFSCSLGESPPSELRLASFAAKNLESLPNLAQPCSAFVPDLRRVAIQSHYRESKLRFIHIQMFRRLS